MPTMTPHLLSPLDLGPFEVRNRLVMGSMHLGLEDRAEDVPALAAFLAERARGGAGLIVTGGFSPNRTGRLTPHGAQVTAATARDHRLITRDVHEAVEKVQIRELAIDAVVHDMKFVISMAPWSCGIIHCYRSLQCTTLYRKRFNRIWRMRIMICIHPSLGTSGAVCRDEEYDIF